MQLVYGVLRNRQSLDRILQTLSSTPIAKIDPFIHQTLAVGLYQLFFLQRIPQAAAVHEMVECCKKKGLPKRLNGFVNGILRQAIRRLENLRQQILANETVLTLTNHPEWLVERWSARFGPGETARICAANNREPVLVLRANGEKIRCDELQKLLTAAGIVNRPGNYAKEAVLLPEYQGAITAIPGYAEGFFQVQDEAAQMATGLLAPFRSGGSYLDACAGLGGKTTHLLQLAADHALTIHAAEPQPFRLSRLVENLKRWASSCVPVIHATTLQELNTQELMPFDGILIDAPCSGTGVTGRHPDIRWNRRPEDLSRYQHEQIELLNYGARLLATGGILVYATCSLEPEENDEVVQAFLATHPAFSLTDCRQYLPEKGRCFVVDHCFAPRPDATIDGFFAARLQHR